MKRRRSAGHLATTTARLLGMLVAFLLAVSPAAAHNLEAGAADGFTNSAGHAWGLARASEDYDSFEDVLDEATDEDVDEDLDEDADDADEDEDLDEDADDDGGLDEDLDDEDDEDEDDEDEDDEDDEDD